MDARDAEDLREILVAASCGSHLERLYEDGVAELDVHGWDHQLAGAAFLGGVARGQMGGDARAEIGNILEEEVSSVALLPAEMGHRIAENRAMLEAFRDRFVTAPTRTLDS